MGESVPMTVRSPPRARSELLPTEVGLVQSPSLARRQPRLGEGLDDLVGEHALLTRERRRGSLPAQLSADVLVQAGLRASYLVGAAMQVAHLIEEGLELALFDPGKGTRTGSRGAHERDRRAFVHVCDECYIRRVVRTSDTAPGGSYARRIEQEGSTP
jgi:hypothetical protein